MENFIINIAGTYVILQQYCCIITMFLQYVASIPPEQNLIFQNLIYIML